MEQHLIFKDLLPLLQTIVGGLLAFLGVALSSILLHKKQKSTERRNLTSAFYGEIRAILKIINDKQYIRAINLSIRAFKAGRRVSLTIRITREYLRVYDKNVDKIGVFDSPLPEKIVEFYMSINGLFEDLDLINKPGFFDNVSTETCISVLSNILSSLQRVSKCGQEICNSMRPHRHAVFI